MDLKHLESIVRDRLEAVYIELLDESSRHRGHAGSLAGGHLKALIVSPAFENRALLERHRLVYEALRNEMSSGIHSLGLKTYTPEEWKSKQAGW